MAIAPGQAAVLRRIARHGRAGFYEGAVARDMIDSLREAGGTHGLEDLAAVASTYSEPVASPNREVELVEHALNGPGATSNLLMNILARFDIAALDPLGAERAHLQAEATRLAFDARDRFLDDADSTTRLAHMLDPQTAARLAALIDPERAHARVAPRTEAIHRDTVTLTVVDRDRMAVSLIYSIYHSFGARLASRKFGIAFDNRGAGFTLEAGHPNEAAGSKRPMHTIIPGMVRQGGRVLMPFGVMGGAYQPCGHARLVSNMVDFGMDPQQVIDAPRAFAGLFSGRDGMALETGYDGTVHQALAARGHAVRWSDEPLGGAQAIVLDPSGVLIGASDPRKDGIALGY